MHSHLYICLWKSKKGPNEKTPTELEVQKVLAEGLINHVSGNYDDCWPELCIIKKTGNHELKADGIDLNQMNDHKQTEFKVGVPRLFSVQEGQNLVTLYRSCESESYNNVKTRHLPKRMRFTVTYALRNYICGLERNEGFLCVLQKLIRLLDIPDMTDSEVESINKYGKTALNRFHPLINQ